MFKKDAVFISYTKQMTIIQNKFTSEDVNHKKVIAEIIDKKK